MSDGDAAGAPRCASHPDYMLRPENGNRYYAAPMSRPWQAAREDCESTGAHLVTISNDAENSYVVDLFDNEVDVWIGYNDIDEEGTFVWLTGEPRSYENWDGGEPNQDGDEDCVELRDDRGDEWNDRECDYSRRYVCECETNE